jgi:hypothetical protein
MLRHLTVTLVLCALVLAACGPKPVDAPPEAPVVREEEPAEVAQPVVEAVAPQRIAPAGQVERIGAFDRQAQDRPTPTATPEAVPTAAPDIEAEEPLEEAEATEATDATPPPEEDAVATEAPTTTPRSVAPAAIPLPATRPPSRVVSTSALVVLDDETPAPPLTVIVSMNREFEGHRFRISGLVRNDADQPYAGLWMNATFFRDDGSRYGPVREKVPCPILEPGSSCPFTLEAADKGITQVMLHPDGYPIDRHTVPVELRNVGHYQDALGYVHVTGTVYNPNPVTVRDVTITGVLVDQAGEIVSLGGALLVQPLEAGASARFEVLIRHVPYVRYELFVQALPR